MSTKLVQFNCPEPLLDEFDKAYPILHFKDRTEALLSYMREAVEEAARRRHGNPKKETKIAEKEGN